MKLCRRQPGVWVSCAEQESNLIVHVCSKAVSMHVFFSLEYCAPVWISSAESHLDLPGSIVRSAERLCEDELCNVAHRRKASALYLLCKIYYRMNYSTNECLNHFVAARNTRALAALGELVLVISRRRTDQFSRSFLHAVVRLWYLIAPGVFSGGTISSLKAL